MNKTVTINLGGLVFHINEDAFAALQAYLGEIRNYIRQQEGADEMLADIESRIAELLQTALGTNRQVVEMKDVEQIKTILGNPADFATEDNAGRNQNDQTNYEKIKKRLFRNPDDQVIGGVCSGLGAYLDVDTTWVRLAMVLLVAFAGLSFWVYLVLWLVVPLASTAADRYAMRGEPGNLENIVRNFQEEARDFTRKQKQNVPRYQEMSRSVLNPAFRLFGVIIGAFLLVLGLALLAVFIMSLLGIGIAAGNSWLFNWRVALFESSESYVMAVIAYILLAGIPIAMLIYAALKLMLHITYRNRWLNAGLSLMWLIGLVIGMYILGSTLFQFVEDTRIRETKRYKTNDTLTVAMHDLSTSYGCSQIDEDRGHQEGYVFVDQDGKNTILGMTELIIVPSDNDSLSVTVVRSSNGSDARDANKNARAIEYGYTVSDRLVSLNDVFVFPGQKFRGQEIEVRIQIPIGKVIYFDRNCRQFIDEAENESKVWPGRIAGRKWIMTENGLRCIDCKGLETEEEIIIEHKDEERVTLNKEGVYINGEDAEVSIDDKGIRVIEKEKVEKKK